MEHIVIHIMGKLATQIMVLIVILVQDNNAQHTMESILYNYHIVFHLITKLVILMLDSSVDQLIYYNAIFQG